MNVGQEINQWRRDSGDINLRYDYNLNENSIVFDLGGFRGEFANKIYEKFSCKVYVFEPVKLLYNEIVSKFRGNPNIKIFNFGLYNKTCEADIYLNGSSSSHITNSSSVKETIKLVNISEFMIEENCNIDLMKINIEGAEYEIIDKLYEENLLNKIKEMQVQFHWVDIPDCEEKLISAQQKLAKTHKPTWSYKFVWENWKRNY